MHQICPTDDSELLHAFAFGDDQAAFRQLVDRHARWVFAAALRQLREYHLAEEAVQIVFILLAQKAAKMNNRPKLTGWLFNTLQYTIKDLRRAIARRSRHEQCAARDSAAPTEEPIAELAEILDPAVARLPDPYRVAILLRFYQGMDYEQIASGLAITQAAARKRVNRGLGLLRKLLGSQVDESLIGASALFGGEQAARTLSSYTANTALTAHAGGALTGSTAAAVKGVSLLMTISKIQTAVIAIVAALVLVPAGIYVAKSARSQTPVVVAISPSSAPAEELPSAVVDDGDSYSLRPGEIIKCIANTGQKGRMDLLRPIVPSSGMDLAHPPVAMLVEIKNGQPSSWSWDYQNPYQLSGLIEQLLATYPQQTEGLSTAALIPGDILYSGDSTTDQRRAALQQLLQGQLHEAVTLTYRDVPRKVIVLDGDWSYTPATPKPRMGEKIDTIELFEDKINMTAFSCSMCDRNSLAGLLGKYTNEQVVIDAHQVPAQLVGCTNEPADRVHDRKLMLDHVAEQTGLTWSEQTRTVRRLFVEPAK